MTEAQERALEVVRAAGQRGVSPAQLADALWPPDPERPETTNRSHRHDGRAGALRATYPMLAGRLLWALLEAGEVYRQGRTWVAIRSGRP